MQITIIACVYIIVLKVQKPIGLDEIAVRQQTTNNRGTADKKRNKQTTPPQLSLRKKGKDRWRGAWEYVGWAETARRECMIRFAAEGSVD
jgi:hypothetical protein